jgi:hypothetical protein
VRRVTILNMPTTNTNAVMSAHPYSLMRYT